MIAWSDEKDELFRSERGVGFQDAVAEIEGGRVLALIQSRSRPNQRIFVIRLRGYVHYVPFVRDDEGNYYLKTVYPNRKGQKLYGG